ncbi:MFS general substrate transporter [Aulographum hederae CBS 113979]|uniref:MFS general substrate transporter n=1 Tax=Aulographum hederae CBS 113979 TaxID=1176131 RepID=A0A6G1GVY5_9PEZI|nr:MFS general substrate transporter [Aulographum hederae CBS 113979]
MDEKQEPDGQRQLHSSQAENGSYNKELSVTADPSKGDEDIEHGSKENTEAVEQTQYISGAKLVIVLASVTLIVFLMMLDMSIVVVAIPVITSDFHSLDDVGWYGSAYMLANCALQPLAGKFYTLFSSKITFISFLALFELGSALCGAAQSSMMLIIGRAIAGLGGAGLVNGALTILSASAPMERRPALLGIMIGISQFGVIGGPLIGGALTEYASWRWCFYINLPIGGVAFLFLMLIKLPDHEKDQSKKSSVRVALSNLDLSGFVLFAGFAVMILLALEWGGTDYPWNSAIVIGLFCGGGLTLLLFAAWEYRMGDNAMIPYSLVKRTVVWSSCLVTLFFFASVMLLTYYLPIYFQAVRGVSPTLSGVYMLPGILGQMSMAVISGILVGKLGYYLPWSIACAILVPIGNGLMTTFTPTSPTAAWVCYQLLSGIGRGSGLQMPIVAIQNNLPTSQVSLGMSLVTFFQTFGGALFLSVAQTIFSHELLSNLREYSPSTDAQAVITAGAASFRDVITPEEVPSVLRAYNDAIKHDFYLLTGVSCAMILFIWGMGWVDIRKKKEKVPTPEERSVSAASE